MWMRDEAKPTPYKGQTLRSGLEARVAEQLGRAQDRVAAHARQTLDRPTHRRTA